jgi:methionyl-tRNA formyltransferase
MIRFAYGCLPSLPSLYFANYLARRAELVPACIVLSTGGIRFQKKRYSTARALPLFFRRFGPRFTSYLALSGLGASLPSLRLPSRSMRSNGSGGLLGFERLARSLDIPLLFSEDFSGPETLALLEPFDLDLFVTCMCDQILRAPLLDAPRLGCLNIHASLLPDFRGVDSVFQAMLHDMPEIGATLHRTTARIDCGDSYGQLAFPRRDGDSHLLLLARAAAAGALLLRCHLGALGCGAPPLGTPIDVSTARFPYRSWPERDELRTFRARGLSFWRAADFRRLLRFEDVLAS